MEIANDGPKWQEREGRLLLIIDGELVELCSLDWAWQEGVQEEKT